MAFPGHSNVVVFCLFFSSLSHARIQKVLSEGYNFDNVFLV